MDGTNDSPLLQLSDRPRTKMQAMCDAGAAEVEGESLVCSLCLESDQAHPPTLPLYGMVGFQYDELPTADEGLPQYCEALPPLHPALHARYVRAAVAIERMVRRNLRRLLGILQHTQALSPRSRFIDLFADPFAKVPICYYVGSRRSLGDASRPLCRIQG